MEYHPRINRSASLIKEPRIILGSFPTWSLTAPDPEKNETQAQKEFERTKNEDINYFYGSKINRFWSWYQAYVDAQVLKNDIISIESSLKRNLIGITDVILSCSRKDKSALDKHLIKRIYNHQFFKEPKKGETIKILCTSKGVMNEMLLRKQFFDLYPKFKVNIEKSKVYQNQLIRKVNGDDSLVSNPFYRFIEVKSGGNLECMSIPSPGSPYRRLVDFGFISDDADAFLNDYLRIVFEWFIS